MTAAVQRLAIALAVLCSAACGTSIAQTAKPGQTLDDGGDGSIPRDGSSFQCMLSTHTTPLPSDPQWGGGDVPQSSVLVGSYGSGEGPGVYVVSPGSFRLYVNGLLLVASTTPGQATFVPLTLLPGDNVVAVVAANDAGAPLALVHVDELEKPYVSSASDWKVSVNPTGDWRTVGYDDRNWMPATDFGAFGTQPGCDPVRGFPSDSAAKWIGAPGGSPSTIALRTQLHIAAVGFGTGTTGGDTAAPTLAGSPRDVENALAGETPAVVLLPEGLMDLRPTGADVRQQMTCPMPCSDPSKTAYTVVVGTFACDQPAVTLPRNDRRILVGSNKTLVGLGRGALLRGASLLVGASNNVILRNIAIYDVNPSMIEAGDGVTIAGADHVWIDHVTYRWISDGFDDVSAGSTNITASWIHYDGRNELECSGRHVRSAEVTSSTMTFHHDWWDNSEGRAPAVDGAMAQVHLVDNLWNDNPSYALGSFCAAQVIVEEAYMENVATPTLKGDNASSCPGVLGSIDARAGTNFYDPNVGPHRQNDVDMGEPHDAVFTPPYDKIATDQALDVKALLRLRAGAGSRWRLPFERN